MLISFVSASSSL